MRHVETIDVLHGGGNVSLVHTAPIEGEDLALYGEDVALMLLDNLRLERALAITWHMDGDFSQGSLERLLGIAVAGIVTGIGACMAGITEMVLHLCFEGGLEDGGKDMFDDLLYILRILRVIGFHNLLGDVVRRSGNHFAFCHGWIVLLGSP